MKTIQSAILFSFLFLTGGLYAQIFTDPGASSFNIIEGANPGTTQRPVGVYGTFAPPYAPITFSAHPDQPWINITYSTNITALGQPGLILFKLDTSALTVPPELPHALYSGNIYFSSSAGTYRHGVQVVVQNPYYSPPQICIDTNQLTMATNEGANPFNTSFQVTNCGGGTASYQVTESAPWLWLSGASGSLTEGQTANVLAHANVAGMLPGVYNTILTLSGNGGDLYIDLELTIYEDTLPADLCLNLPFLDQTTVAGSSAPAQTLIISNCGEETLSYTLSENLSWLSLSNTSGWVGNGQSVDITVNYNSAALAPGSYNGVIAINSNGGNQTVDVNLTVTESLDPAEVQLSLSSISAATYQGLNAGSRQFTLQNIGEQVLNYQFSDSASWLTLNRTSGNLGGGNSLAVTASFQTAGLAVGSYYGEIDLITNVGSYTIPVNLTIGEPLYLPSVSVKEISEVVTSGNNLPSRTFTLENLGTGEAMKYRISVASLDLASEVGVNYMSVSPSSGTLLQNQTQTVNINYSTGSLAVGKYKGVITVGTDGGTAQITYLITVQAPIVGSEEK